MIASHVGSSVGSMAANSASQIGPAPGVCGGSGYGAPACPVGFSSFGSTNGVPRSVGALTSHPSINAPPTGGAPAVSSIPLAQNLLMLHLPATSLEGSWIELTSAVSAYFAAERSCLQELLHTYPSLIDTQIDAQSNLKRIKATFRARNVAFSSLAMEAEAVANESGMQQRRHILNQLSASLCRFVSETVRSKYPAGEEMEYGSVLTMGEFEVTAAVANLDGEQNMEWIDLAPAALQDSVPDGSTADGFAHDSASLLPQNCSERSAGKMRPEWVGATKGENFRPRAVNWISCILYP